MAISLEISKEIKIKLDNIARKTERTRSQVIRLAIKSFIENQGEKNGQRV